MMQRWHNFWNTHDPDSVFKYSTIKLVQIQDRYLGILHYSLMIGIFIYVVVYVIFVQKSFLKPIDVIGPVKVNLIDTGSNYTFTPGSLKGFNCTYDPTQNEKSNVSVPYCMFPSAAQIISSAGQTVFITTYQEATTYSQTCSVTNDTCKPTATNGPIEYVVANLETMSVTLDHSYQAAESGKAPFGDTAPTGVLQVSDGKSWVNCGTQQVCKNEISTFKSLGSDVIPLRLLVSVAGIDLDSIANDYLAGSTGYTGPRSTREFGAVVLLVVNYDNKENYWLSVRTHSNIVDYQYRPSYISQINDFNQDLVYTTYPSEYVQIVHRGVRIIPVLTGSIYEFDFQTMLIQLTTALTLLTVATTIVDQIAIRFFPRRLLYQKAKYELTEDFSDIIAKRKAERDLVGSPSTEML